MAQASQYIQSHEGLRGVAAFCVVLFHASMAGLLAPALAEFWLVANGWISVDLFFALSGFVMFFRYGDDLRRHSDAGRFILRRIGRLYPLHLATLLLFIVTWLLIQSTKWVLMEHFGMAVGNPRLFGADRFNWPDLFLNLGLLHGIGLRWTDALNFPSWSVSLEFWTYFIFLAVCLAASRTTVRVVVFAGLALISIGWLLSVAAHEPDFVAIFQAERSFARILMSFGVGACVAGWVRHHRISAVRAGWWQLAAFAALVFYYRQLDDLGAWLLIGPFVFGLTIYALCTETGWFARILKLPALAWLGARSYSIYLVHATMVMVGSAAGRLLGPGSAWPLTGLYIVATLALANLTYQRIEVPARARFRALAASPSRVR